MVVPPIVGEELTRTVLEDWPWRESVSSALRKWQWADWLNHVDGGAVANWIWLSPTEPQGRALVVGDILGRSAASLSCHFDDVTLACMTKLEVDFARARMRQDGVGNVEVVFAGDIGHLPGSENEFNTVLVDRVGLDKVPMVSAEAFRLLKEGGVLAISDINPRFHHDVRSNKRFGLSPSRLSRLVRKQGFRSVELYYSGPVRFRAEWVVPAQRNVITGLVSGARSWLTRAGLHALIYPDQLILGERP